MSANVKKHLSLLGLKVKDRVTGFEGIVASLSFDLYGCIQAVVNPGLDKDGKQRDQAYYDVSRLEVTDTTPCMPVPNFDFGDVAEGKQGAAERPADIKP